MPLDLGQTHFVRHKLTSSSFCVIKRTDYILYCMFIFNIICSSCFIFSIVRDNFSMNVPNPRSAVVVSGLESVCWCYILDACPSHLSTVCGFNHIAGLPFIAFPRFITIIKLPIIKTNRVIITCKVTCYGVTQHGLHTGVLCTCR